MWEVPSESVVAILPPGSCCVSLLCEVVFSDLGTRNPPPPGRPKKMCEVGK